MLLMKIKRRWKISRYCPFKYNGIEKVAGRWNREHMYVKEDEKDGEH
jgi:hypothetical protein